MNDVAKFFRALFRNLGLPLTIAAVVEVLFGFVGFMLWFGLTQLAPIVNQRFHLRSADYLAHIVERIRESLYDLTVAAAGVALAATVIWFIFGWWISSRLAAPGGAYRHRWAWALIGGLSFIIYVVVGIIISDRGALMNRAGWFFWGISASYIVGFGLLYWLGSLFGTPPKLRPAVPCSTMLPATYRW